MKTHFGELAEILKLPSELTNHKPPYIHCNEQCQLETIATLPQPVSPSKNKLHIGFSVWFNLDIIAVTQPQFAIILDIDPSIGGVYKQLTISLIASSHPEAFIAHFLSELIKKNITPYPEETQRQYLEKELNKEYGFLSSLDSFLYIKEMAQEGRILFGQADLLSEDHIGPIEEWTKARNLEIQTLYLSNIPEWITEYSSPEHQQRMINNIKRLITHETLIIDAFYLAPTKDKNGPPQRISFGTLPSFKRKSNKARLFPQPSNSYKKLHLPKTESLELENDEQHLDSSISSTEKRRPVRKLEF